MTSRILAFAGNKQSGKTTSSNFLHGYQLRASGVINNFAITEEGKLVIETVMLNDSGKEEINTGMLDINRDDIEFAEWASYNVWPYIKNYSFAKPLKEFCIELFGLPRENVYGVDTLKNQKTHFKWQEMPGVITDKKTFDTIDKKLFDSGVLFYHKPGNMTYRELLQFFGTNICRKIYEDIWHRKLINDITVEQPLIAIVDDCRFLNEVEAIKAAGGKVIHLTRHPYKDNHKSENDLLDYDGFDFVIDNNDMSIHETNIKILEVLDSWGWLGREIIPQKNQPTKEIVGGIHKIKRD